MAKASLRKASCTDTGPDKAFFYFGWKHERVDIPINTAKTEFVSRSGRRRGSWPSPVKANRRRPGGRGEILVSLPRP
jgi:hypothetical protein